MTILKEDPHARLDDLEPKDVKPGVLDTKPPMSGDAYLNRKLYAEKHGRPPMNDVENIYKAFGILKAQELTKFGAFGAAGPIPYRPAAGRTVPKTTQNVPPQENQQAEENQPRFRSVDRRQNVIPSSDPIWQPKPPQTDTNMHTGYTEREAPSRLSRCGSWLGRQTRTGRAVQGARGINPDTGQPVVPGEQVRGATPRGIIDRDFGGPSAANRRMEGDEGIQGINNTPTGYNPMDVSSHPSVEVADHSKIITPTSGTGAAAARQQQGKAPRIVSPTGKPLINMYGIHPSWFADNE